MPGKKKPNVNKMFNNAKRTIKNNVTTRRVRHVADGVSDIGNMGGDALLAASIMYPELAPVAGGVKSAGMGARRVSKLLKKYEKPKKKKGKK